MAIVTALVIETDMAIVTVDLETDIHGYQMQGTRSRVASGAPSTLVSSTRRLPRLSLVF